MTAVLENCAIILLGAGSSVRMGFDKLWVELGGRPLLAWAIGSALQAEPAELVVVAPADRHDDVRQIASSARVVTGGPRRRDSVAAGLAASGQPWVAIHDGARALVPPALFAEGFARAQSTGAAVPGVPVKDTIKRFRADRVLETLARDELVAVQTPQVYRRQLLAEALASSDADVTDEAALLESLGLEVAVFAGHESNFKVTTPLDLELARLIAGHA